MVRYLVRTAYLPRKFAEFAYKFFENFVPTSKYMFFLDASPEVLLKRVENRKEKEMFETLEEFENVRKKAIHLVKKWNIIDISGSINESVSKIEKILDKLDKNK